MEYMLCYEVGDVCSGPRGVGIEGSGRVEVGAFAVISAENPGGLECVCCGRCGKEGQAASLKLSI